MAEVMTGEDVYIKLREFLHGFPAGFPPFRGGTDLTMLRMMFTPEEAMVETNMRQALEPASAIASRCGMSAAEAERVLDSMAGKGLIWKVEGKGKPLYLPIQYAVGFLEETVMQRLRRGAMERELAELWDESTPDVSEWWKETATKQVRVVPVGAAVDATRTVATYDRIREAVREQKDIAVAYCVCKQVQVVMDKPCERSVETCLAFGYAADHWVEVGLGRRIDAREALEILDRAEESGLVLQPNNAEELVFICCCCSCCCGIIRALNLMERPADHVHSTFQARIDADLCENCGTCLERCQMDALVEKGEATQVDLARCIGCGLCLSACPENAISMVAKQAAWEIPATYLDTQTRMARDRGQPLGQLNRLVKNTSFDRYIKQWSFLHRIHIAEPIINVMARRGWV